MAVTVIVTTDDETWHGVLSFGAGLVVLLFVAESLRMVLESLGLLVLVNGIQDEKITAIEALELTIEGHFIGQLMPISAAGVPYQGFLLIRKGVRAGLATAIVLVKGFVPGVFFFFVLVGATTLTALGWEGSEGTVTFLKIVGPLSAVPLVRKIEESRVMMESESHVFREALTTLGRHKRWVLFWGVLLVVLAYIAEFMVAIVILRGFGYRGSMIGPLVLQCLLKPVITATPTPGSLAFGEGGYIGFFAAFLPARFVGVSLVLWRLALYFVPMSVGGVLVAKRIGRKGFTGKTPQST
jgi:uncharacterized membrane protein YbhN (UPF0104 family)